MSVKLRKRKNSDGTTTLYLDGTTTQIDPRRPWEAGSSSILVVVGRMEYYPLS